MKNSYLNDVLNFGVEIGVIKKNKNILLKTLEKKKNKKKIL
jgi:hypothetical protein